MNFKFNGLLRINIWKFFFIAFNRYFWIDYENANVWITRQKIKNKFYNEYDILFGEDNEIKFAEN